MLTNNWKPQNSDREPRFVAWVAPAILNVDGVDYDLSLMNDGDIAEHPIILRAERNADDYMVTLTLPHGANAPDSTRFPLPQVINDHGVVSVPVYNVGVL